MHIKTWIPSPFTSNCFHVEDELHETCTVFVSDILLDKTVEVYAFPKTQTNFSSIYSMSSSVLILF